MNRERYHKGAHAVLELKYHFIWKTKYGYRVLNGNIALRTREIIRDICRDKKMVILKGNVRPNHVHLLVQAPSHLSPSKMAQYLKGTSSYRLQQEFPSLRKRFWGRHLWNRGYFCSTVGAVTEEQIRRYIEHQEEGEDSFKVWDEPKEDIDKDNLQLE